VAQNAATGILRVDDELHLTPLAALEEDPKLAKLRAALDEKVGEDSLFRRDRTADSTPATSPMFNSDQAAVRRPPLVMT
jgi:hypothetical protein